MGIALDVTRTGDTPKTRTMEVSLGGGAAIKVKDSSVIAHPAFKNYMVKIAKEKGIKYQMEVLEAGGTDTAAIQMTKAGIPAGCISIPCRYIHSPARWSTWAMWKRASFWRKPSARAPLSSKVMHGREP